MRSIVPMIAMLLTACTQAPLKQLPSALAATASTTVEEPGGEFNRLHIGTTLALPPNARTVGAAMRHVLEPTGYTLIGRSYLIDRPLRAVTVAGPLTVEAALLHLIGSECVLIVDHAHRKVGIAHRESGVRDRVLARTLD